MALWPNNRTNILGSFPVGISAYLAFQETQQRVQRNIAYFTNTTIQPTSSVPEGSFQSPACILAPIVSGGMASGNNNVDIVGGLTGNILNGGPVSGAASATFTGSGSVALIIGMNGEATATFSTGAVSLALTLGMAGEATATLSGVGSLGMIVPISGAATATWSVNTDLKGLLSLSGDITPYTELSPESLAAAVWNALAASFADSGTMGALLNAAGSGGMDPALVQKIEELWTLAGLDIANPLVVTSASRDAGAISQTIDEDGGTVTVTRD